MKTDTETDIVTISREYAMETLRAMEYAQSRAASMCGELNDAIKQLREALEKEQ